ncbi:MAG TPA: AAA family ATPase [Solimonas sp.]|nr:AAA family ATPase [Solimonas sp.]
MTAPTPATGSLLEGALRWAADGTKVFPLVDGAKTPAIEDFANVATRDPARIRDWLHDEMFGPQPGNLGIYTGAFGDDGGALLVLDFDIRKDELGNVLKDGMAAIGTWAAQGLYLPATRTQRTPSGGQHWIYRAPAAVACSGSKLAPGVDVRSAGGYTVAAPSRTAKGKYVCDWTPIVEAPQWLIDLCGKPRERDPQASTEPHPNIDQVRAEQRAIDYLRNHAPESVLNQGGNATAYAVAARVKDFGVSADEALELMMEHWFEGSGWSTEKLQAVVQHAYNYGRQSVGAAAAEVAFKPVAPEPAPAPRALIFGAQHAAARYAGKVVPELDWVIHGVLPAGRAAATIGPGGVSKSMLALQAGIAVATGGQFLGRFPCKPGAALYLSAEDGEDELHRRLARMAQAHAVDLAALHRFYAVPRVAMRNLLTDGRPSELYPTDLAQHIAEDAARLPGGPPRLIVLDPVSRFRGGEENSAPDATRFVEVAEHLAAYTGAAILLVHHANKGSYGHRDAGQGAARGSSALTDGVRTQLNMRPMTGDEAHKTYKIGRDRAPYFVELTIPKRNYSAPVPPLWLERREGGVLFPADLGELADARGLDDEEYADVLGKVRSMIEGGVQLSRRQFEMQHSGKGRALGISAPRVRAALCQAVGCGDLYEPPAIGRKGAILALHP